MLPGNGRHRRPRQAPALVVAAGVTGSAIAIPLLGAASAHATDAVTWDRLADCESGSSWSIVPGNGHFGGLQLTQEAWVTHGGLAYALSANKASRVEQIAIAEKVLADEGPGAWPGCAILAGLTPSKSPAPSASPSDSAGGDSASSTPSAGSSADTGASGSGSAASKSPKPSATSTGADGAKQDKSGDSGKSDTSGSGDSSGAGDGSGRHRGDTAEEGSGHGGSDGSAGRHASRDKDREGADGAYTVRPGDNLWAIAEAHDLDGGWPALYAANKKTVGDDPDLILPGQDLDLSAGRS